MDCFSAAYKTSKISCFPSEQSSQIRMSSTWGFPSVIVPVLSITTALTLLKVSIWVDPLMRIPCLAALLMVANMVGEIEATKAHGLATTSKTMPL